MNMTIKCTSIFGIEHNERVYIGKQQDAKAGSYTGNSGTLLRFILHSLTTI